MILCYITDRSQFPGSEQERRNHLLARIEQAGNAGVDLIQLREKDLSARDMEALARSALQRLQPFSKTKLLINSRTDVCMAVGAHGVHLRSRDLSAADARVSFGKSKSSPDLRPVIGVSCHTLAEVAMAESQGADFAVFGPVFEKEGGPLNQGLEALHQACQREGAAAARMPVLALGGVNLRNSADCLAAGAAGIAGIRLFQQGDLAATVRELRSLTTPKPSAASHQRHPYKFDRMADSNLPPAALPNG